MIIIAVVESSRFNIVRISTWKWISSFRAAIQMIMKWLKLK